MGRSADQRISARVNQSLYNHATKRAREFHGNNISDYLKELIRADMDGEVKDAKEWQERIDKQIDEMKGSLEQLLKVREDVMKTLKSDQVRG